jgi:hypothetical protein
VRDVFRTRHISIADVPDYLAEDNHQIRVHNKDNLRI